MSLIAACLHRRFPGDGRIALIRDSLQRSCEDFVASGLADPKFEIELTSSSDGKFWSSLSEALVYERLRGKNFLSRAKIGSGPDFLLKSGSKRVWIEVVCPEPKGLPPSWSEFRPNSVTTFPHEEILLRWTSAIAAKADRLLGSADRKGYLDTGIVLPDDIYVIAVNGCQMRRGPGAYLHGISQFPFAAEAVFPIGPFQVQIDRYTLESVGSGHQHRPEIKKPNGASVPTHMFLDPRYGMVSAIWAVDFTGEGVIGNPEPSALIHNPNALNPLPRQFLTVDEEYEAVPKGEDKFVFQRLEA